MYTIAVEARGQVVAMKEESLLFYFSFPRVY